jgi:hypothetical protein
LAVPLAFFVRLIPAWKNEILLFFTSGEVGAGSVEAIGKALGLTEVFAGVIIVAIISNANQIAS